MAWSDFELPQFLFVKNVKQCLNFTARCVKNVTFQKVGSNFGIFKQGLENGPIEFHKICGSKDVAIKIC